MNPDKITSAELLQIRSQLGLNQTQFWSRIGITQSGGCRYENGRSIPKPVRLLIGIAYGKNHEAIVESLRVGN